MSEWVVYQTVTGSTYELAYISAYRPPSLIHHSPWQRIVVGLVQSCRLTQKTWPLEFRCNYVYKLRCTLQIAIFDLSLILTSDIRLTVLFDPKIYAYFVEIWNLTHIPSAISGTSTSGFTSAILISRLNADRIVYAQGDVSVSSGILKNKSSNVEFAHIGNWRPLINSMITKFITFSPRNHPLNLHFRWRHSITGRLCRKFQRHFDHQLWSLWECAEVHCKMSTGYWDIQVKWGDCSL